MTLVPPYFTWTGLIGNLKQEKQTHAMELTILPYHLDLLRFYSKEQC